MWNFNISDDNRDVIQIQSEVTCNTFIPFRTHVRVCNGNLMFLLFLFNFFLLRTCIRWKPPFFKLDRILHFFPLYSVCFYYTHMYVSLRYTIRKKKSKDCSTAECPLDINPCASKFVLRVSLPNVERCTCMLIWYCRRKPIVHLCPWLIFVVRAIV